MEEIIKVKHLKKYFKDVKAVDDISFSVEKGEMFGFLGVNGAGKSTTINMLCTLYSPTEGNVEVDGLVLGKDDEEIKRHIGVVYQNNCLDKLLTVKENLFLRGGLYETDSKKLKDNLDYVCRALELEGVLDRRYGKLSGGLKRRCEIARSLMHTPDILFLDEPTTGLDPATRKSVWEAISRMQNEMNMTVFLTTHYMEEAARAKHIAIMNTGKLAMFGTPFSLKEDFAKDRLRLIPKENCRQQLVVSLENSEIPYQLHKNHLTVFVDSTFNALPIIERIKRYIEGFEVIQGTMDDVFLNVTNGGAEI